MDIVDASTISTYIPQLATCMQCPPERNDKSLKPLCIFQAVVNISKLPSTPPLATLPGIAAAPSTRTWPTHQGSYPLILGKSREKIYLIKSQA